MMHFPFSARLRRGLSTIGILTLIIGAGAILGLGILIGNASRDDRSDPAAREAPSASESANAGADAADDVAEQLARLTGAADSRDDDAAADARPAVTDGPPPIVFDPPSLDFGFVQPNLTLTGSVQIVNPTDQPLRIVASRASCTCTAVNLANTTIEPGGSVPLDITFETGAALGEKGSSVRVLIEGYGDTAHVTLNADVALMVYAVPPHISAVRNMETGDPQMTGTFEVRSQDEQPFRVLRVNNMEPTFVDFNPETDEPRSAYTLTWDFTDVNEQTCRHPDGRPVQSWWVIETDHPECPVFDMQVRHTCTRTKGPGPGQNWVLSEHRALVGELAPGESAEFEVNMKWLRNATPNDRIYSVLSGSRDLRAELVDFDPSGEEQTCRVRITLLPRARPGMLYETIYFNAKNHNMPFLITGRVTSADE